jgi:hypothetical protein
VAFSKLTDCDKSDIALWANQLAMKEFEREIISTRDASLRALIKKPTEEKASDVRAYEKILCLIEEARSLR